RPRLSLAPPMRSNSGVGFRDTLEQHTRHRTRSIVPHALLGGAHCMRVGFSYVRCRSRRKPCFSASEVLEPVVSKIASAPKLKSSPRHAEGTANDPMGRGVEITAGEKKWRGGHGPAPAMKVLMQILRVKRMRGFGAASVRKCVSARRMTI